MPGSTIKDICGAPGPKDNTGRALGCRRKKGHTKHHSKYQRQHMDSRKIPAVYWEPTEEELKEESA